MSSSGPTLVILAAGMGSRYGGLKQIDPIGPNSEIVIDYSIYDAIEAGFTDIVFVIRRELESDFRAMIDQRGGQQINCHYAFQELSDVPPDHAVPENREKPWGTAHAIYAARNLVDRPFGVINADDFYGRQSFRLLAEQLANPGPDQYALIAFVLRNTLSDHGSVSRGICRVADGQLQDVVERTNIERDQDAARCQVDGTWQSLTGDEPVSMNMWGFTPGFFEHLANGFADFLSAEGAQPKAEFLIPTVIDTLIQNRTASVDVVLSTEAWLGVTYPEDKPIVQAGIQRLIEQGAYPSPLWKATAAL